MNPRPPALERLDVFVGEWSLEAVFPGNPTEVLRGGRSVFEWMKGEQVLVQHTETPSSNIPNSIAIIICDLATEAYTQHYFDSRGVARLYSMILHDEVWTLLRNSPDFSPLDFSQRYIGTFQDSGDTIHGAWETSSDTSHWTLDFDLRYRRIR